MMVRKMIVKGRYKKNWMAYESLPFILTYLVRLRKDEIISMRDMTNRSASEGKIPRNFSSVEGGSDELTRPAK